MKKFFKNNYLFFIFLLIFILPSIVYAKDSSIVIFDGSGSMKKKIDGKAKFEIASEVMSNLMKDWNNDIDLGLMVYGHRSKACDDIEMVIPIGTPNADKFLAAINNIKPKGETPIAESMKQAAEKLNYEESPTTVILISDGEESCNADPCAMAKKLEENGTDFTAHVIGFDVSSAEQVKALKQLKCVAKSTGGKFIEAKDSEGLKTALIETAKVIAKTKPVNVAPKMTTAKGIIWQDDFKRDALGDAYTVTKLDEDRMAMLDGKLLMIAENSVSNSVTFKQKISGDFEASIKVNVSITRYNSISIGYIANKENLIVLQYYTDSGNDGQIRFEKTVRGTSSTGDIRTAAIGKRVLDSSKQEQKEDEDWFFKIKKQGFSFTGYASIDGKNWVKIEEHTLLKKEGNIYFSVSGGSHEDTFLFDDFVIKKI